MAENDRLKIKIRGEDGNQVFSVRAPVGLMARIDKIAAASGRSRNEVICLLLEFAVDRCDIVK